MSPTGMMSSPRTTLGDQHSQHDPPQPHASSSKVPMSNPQLGQEPFFVFPEPSRAQLEEHLPPYFEGENVPLGPMLDRVCRKGYGDMRTLLETTLPPLSARQKPRHIIDYAKTTRQAVLKYLAVLRWHNAVNIESTVAPPGQSPHQVASFPTPHSREGSTNTSPAGAGAGGYMGKGKGRLIEDDVKPVVRGKVTDTKRIQTFMEHQNKQHDDATAHVKHSAKVVESLRYRNPDILTAVSLATTGTYPRLPTNLQESFIPRTPLTNGLILDTLRRLNAHIRYRLRCVDYLPPSMSLEKISDGRAYISGGGAHGWKAELTVVGFGEGDSGRWWLTGVEWIWKEKGSDDSIGDAENKGGKRFAGEQRQQILDVVNGEILLPKTVPEDLPAMETKLPTEGLATPSGLVPVGSGLKAPPKRKVDAPLVRLSNFIQHLSLSYQLEVMYSQALALAGEKWRNQLMVELDREKKVLRLKYWIRPRPIAPAQQSSAAAAVGKRPGMPHATSGPSRPPMIGATLSISLQEVPQVKDQKKLFLEEFSSCDVAPMDRSLALGLGISWEVGEAGVGGGLKTGDTMETSRLVLDPSNLSLTQVVSEATRIHAALLTRSMSTPLLASPRIALLPRSPPTLIDVESSTKPLTLQIPLPSRYKSSNLLVWISPISGLVEIEDESIKDGSGSDDRAARLRIAIAGIQEGRTKVLDDVTRLIVAIIMEGLESQMKALGWTPFRRLALRSQEMVRADLNPATTIFVPLPTSNLHYFVAKITAQGLSFELLKLMRVTAENEMGMKLAVGDRIPVDLGRLRSRRKEKNVLARKRKRVVTGEAEGDIVMEDPGVMTNGAPTSEEDSEESSFEVDSKDLRNMFIFANALVAQTIVEQQLKDRSIPHTLQYPPTTGSRATRSSSAVAGMVPVLVVNSSDLLKDGRAADVAVPVVYMQIKDWWLGGKCRVVTTVQLRHRAAASDASASPAAATGARQSKAAKAEGIAFDQAASIITFDSPDINKCVPAFLEQWEKMSKVMAVAGSVNRLNKSEKFKDLRMIFFDLRTATFAYSPGYLASITYTPNTDSYVVQFGKTGNNSNASNAGISPAATFTPHLGGTTGLTPMGSNMGNTPGAAPTPSALAMTPINAGVTPGGAAVASGENPHGKMALLLSYRLNELIGSGKVSAGKDFISLLRSTLPFLLEVDSIRSSSPTDFPALVIRSVNTYRLIWDHSSRRYALDITLLPNHEQWLFSDGSTPRNGETQADPSCGPITSFTTFEKIITATYDNLRSTTKDSPNKAIDKSPNPTTGGGGIMNGVPAGSNNNYTKAKEPVAKTRPLAIKLDGGKSLMCESRAVASAVRSFVVEVEASLGIVGGGKAP